MGGKAKTEHETAFAPLRLAREWLAARLKLLKAEKELTRRSDELARQRQECPGSDRQRISIRTDEEWSEWIERHRR